jgi:hypothetical protein
MQYFAHPTPPPKSRFRTPNRSPTGSRAGYCRVGTLPTYFTMSFRHRLCRISQVASHRPPHGEERASHLGRRAPPRAGSARWRGRLRSAPRAPSFCPLSRPTAHAFCLSRQRGSRTAGGEMEDAFSARVPKMDSGKTPSNRLCGDRARKRNRPGRSERAVRRMIG